MALAANFASFDAALRRFGDRLVPAAAARFQRLVSLEAMKRIVLRTPVDTGRARGNWQMTVGRPATTIRETTDPSGGHTIAEAIGAVASITPYNIVWIANNLPYIEPLENGSSQQAPAGMVAITLRELEGLLS